MTSIKLDKSKTPEILPPWESVKRYDGPGGVSDRHYNKFLKKYIETPHVHDPSTPDGIRLPEGWEIPN